MKVHIFALLAALAVLLAGCGGNGTNTNGNTANSQVPEEYMVALKAAVESRDIDFIRSQISNNYKEDCMNKEQFVNEIMSTLGATGAVTFTVEPISNKVVNLNRNTAEFTGGFRIEVVDGEVSREFVQTGRMYLRRDNGPWQLYGEQDCVH
jgi:hypothetical protein